MLALLVSPANNLDNADVNELKIVGIAIITDPQLLDTIPMQGPAGSGSLK